MTEGAMTSAAIIAVCLGGLGLIVWYRVQQARLLGVRYMDPARSLVLAGAAIIATAFTATAAVLVMLD